jgi:hypothetical protein
MAVAETEYRFGMTVLSAVFFPTILGQGAALEIEWIAKITSRITGEAFCVIGFVSPRHNLVGCPGYLNAHMTQHNGLWALFNVKIDTRSA